jgi:hypothetical protein
MGCVGHGVGHGRVTGAATDRSEQLPECLGNTQGLGFDSQAPRLNKGGYHVC